MNIRFLLSILLTVPVVFSATAQERPIGYWRSHLTYNNAVSVATDGATLYAASDQSFFAFNDAANELSTYSKVEGMADVGISQVGYDTTTGYVIIAYNNCNIDLFKDETFFNIPDIKLKSITGTKHINDIFTDRGMAYLSTSFGVVVLNLSKKEVKETYTFSSNSQAVQVRDFTSLGNYFYAVTATGLYKANRNSANLQPFAAWQSVDPDTGLQHILNAGGRIYISKTDSVFSLDNDLLQFGYKSAYPITALDADGNNFWVGEYIAANYSGKMKLFNPSFQAVDSCRLPGQPARIVSIANNTVWVADVFRGLYKKVDTANVAFYQPDGPYSSNSFDILADKGDLWVAHGSYDANWTPISNPQGFSHFDGEKWTVYNGATVPLLQGVTDFIALAKDPADGTLYAGSYRTGIFIINPDGSYQHLKDTSFLESTIGDPGSVRISGFSFDQGGNLWVTQAGAPHELVVKTKAGEWIKYAGGGAGLYSAYVITDDYNQKWYILPGTGIAVYNDNYTPDNPNDDQYARVSMAEISNATNCIVKDREGAVWVGTGDGIGIIHCPEQVIAGTCKVERPIVQYDQFAGYLFQNENVKTIAVDGANRKWIGTSNGVWLISPDGEKIIYRFTAENSPLPADNIQKITVDGVTGDVYIGTDQGLVSYRSTATEGGESNQSVITFPNPVPSGYSGTIAIRGVSENADVRITDIAGQLVYRTKALGGQAVWNGMDYTGRRPSSGVYLIFVTNKDGSQTYSGKMVFMQ